MNLNDLIHDRIDKQLTKKQLMNKYHIGQQKLNKILIEYNCNNDKFFWYKNKPTYQSTNHSYFKKWSHEMAWLLGFIHADGNIAKNKHRLYFCTSEKDKDILHKIQAILCPARAIKKKRTFLKTTNKHYTLYSFYINSVEIVQDLICIGINPQKTR